MATILSADDREQFERDGFVPVRSAFGDGEAAAMRAVVWEELAGRGIRPDDPSTWRDEFPSHLQHLKPAPAFRAVGSARTLGAITELLGARGARAPRDWGGFFLLFPRPRPWSVPWKGWHVDHDWRSAPFPLSGLKVHTMFGDVAPQAGGMTIVAGSHRVITRVVTELGLPPTAPAATIRNGVMRSVPYLRDLSRPDSGEPTERSARIARFVDREEEVLGAPLRVVELTATAGDVILIHPLVLHTRPTNAGDAPRFLLNKDLYPAPLGAGADPPAFLRPWCASTAHDGCKNGSDRA